jgi:hypothetical protein
LVGKCRIRLAHFVVRLLPTWSVPTRTIGL